MSLGIGASMKALVGNYMFGAGMLNVNHAISGW